MKLAKNQANSKQHPEAGFWLFENCLRSLSIFLSKNNKTYSKKQAKEKVSLYPLDYIDHNENE